MKRRVLFATTAAVVALGGTAGAAGERASAGPDLSSRASIDRYLASTGVDPSTVVHQRGMRNYAGPHCPGRGWTCTTSTRAVQDGPAGAQNVFECSDADCSVVQTDAANKAHCHQQDGAAQSCSITQTGTDNDANVEQQIKQRDGTAQEATQKATVDQSAAGGKNASHIHQSVDQDTKAKSSGAIAQSQLADQSADVSQHGSM